MKNKKIIIGSSSVLLLTLITTVVVVLIDKKEVKYDVTKEEAKEAYDLLNKSINRNQTYYDFISGKTINYSLGEFNAEMKESNASDEYGYSQYLLSKNDSSTPNLNIIDYDSTTSYKEYVEYQVTVSSEGLYELELDYYLNDNILTNPTIAISINELDTYQYSEQSTIDVPLKWDGTEAYESEKSFPIDSYEDETVPSNVRLKEWSTLKMYDNKYSTSTPLLFNLNKGDNNIFVRVVSSNCPLILGNLKATSPKKLITYEEYKETSLVKAGKEVNDLVSKNAIFYHEKNSSYLTLSSENNPCCAPFESTKSKLNVMSGNSWKTAGQSLTYTIKVNESGLYKLGFHYSNSKEDYASFRSIYINDEIPFEELRNYSFNDTSTSKWANETLSDKDGNPYLIYFQEGKEYKITLKAELDPVYEIANMLQLVVDHINNFSLDILKITGSDVDEDRNWELTNYIPETVEYLEAYQTLIQYLIMEGSNYSLEGTNSSTLSYMGKALATLKKLMKKPDDLPLYLENLYSGSSSVNQMLGDSISNISNQPLSFDYIYAYGGTHDLPKANASFFKKLGSGVTSLVNTFIDDKYDQEPNPEELSVWINRPLTYINIMQSMVDRDFNNNPDYNGPKIKITVMPDPNKLILANSAGETPDVALGLASYMPFDFALRNAAYDLTSFDDFYTIADRFASGTLVPFNINNSFYALPETLDFQVTMYREDIFNTMGWSVPDNWDELIGLLPLLQRYGMNFYMPISAENSTKWFYQTSPLIYQMGGVLYNESGDQTKINSLAAVKGLTLLTRLYKNNALPTNVPSFYNSFRYGTLPIGTGAFADYLKMKNAAPELVGKWTIEEPLGVYDKDTDTTDRTFISNGTSAMIFKSSNKPNESWDFLKWWTSTEVQVEFGNTLQSTYGPEYVWLSSNLEAVKESSFDSKDKEVILKSLEYITDIPRTPGQYMLERGLSNIWTTVVFDNTPIRVAIDQQVIVINREIRRKLIEFGYRDENNNVLKPYAVHEKEWIEEQIRNKKGG